ncbi:MULTISPECIES: DUF1405 domain-containing protein [Paenibacillus]|uniref:DUF1405 domain-containing protein n=1 Tax=Paenibacillus campinasensis TaxID=66347 RepID=A0ABW9SVL7_9BACL|nr:MULTISPECIES: DUF1405 domain-containing protein [Paenibacillus]MUG65028.1 DUF1405 domain-containing protein [Paenibacillus campinasensis]PAK53603.1 hypothetical protein CHH75_10165 [Paenibacillus sp. 7541]
MSIKQLWSRKFLGNRYILWLLFITNLLGTVYGYIWYGNQLKYTWQEGLIWQLIFVPDSPTASLFFTIALFLLLYPPRRMLGMLAQQLIEALAVVTSVKYGIWAVAIIFAGQWQGDVLVWQDWMLVVSHTAMAVEALLYVRLFHFRRAALAVAIAWTLINDTVDYTFGVYPWLPSVLQDDLGAVEIFTFSLTLFSGLLAWIAWRFARKGHALR